MQAVKWEETYSTDPSKLPWPKLKSAILKLTAKFEKHRKLDNPRPQQRVRVNPAAPTGMALTAQHDDNFQIAFEAAMAAVSHGAPQGSLQEQRTQYPISPHPNPSIICDNCCGRGHIQMFCPSPKFTRQQQHPQQRTSRWERGGRGGGQYRGGARGRGGGSSGSSPHRGSGHTQGSGPRNSGFRGMQQLGSAPFQGLRGGSHAQAASSSESFLDVVQGDPTA